MEKPPVMNERIKHTRRPKSICILALWKPYLPRIFIFLKSCI